MKHLKKFEEIDYTPTEKTEYQSKVDKIMDRFAKMVVFKKFDKLVYEKPILKVNININDSSESNLTIKFKEILIKIYKSDSKVLSVYKPGNGWVFTNDSIGDIMKMISKSKDYIDISESEFDKVSNILYKMVDVEEHINKDINI